MFETVLSETVFGPSPILIQVQTSLHLGLRVGLSSSLDLDSASGLGLRFPLKQLCPQPEA